MNSSQTTLRQEVKNLAREAFKQHLISGYGDGEYGDKYQLVLQGKPRHFRLERARQILTEQLARARAAYFLDSVLKNETATHPQRENLNLSV